MSESNIQSRVRLAAARLGWWLLRNNSGAGKLASGNYVRFGLGNDSPAVNARCKSSDLIGIRPVVITESMVGKTFGLFVAREVKHADWKFNPNDEREVAQKRFIDRINDLGGDAAFVSDPETVTDTD